MLSHNLAIYTRRVHISDVPCRGLLSFPIFPHSIDPLCSVYLVANPTGPVIRLHIIMRDKKALIIIYHIQPFVHFANVIFIEKNTIQQTGSIPQMLCFY